MPTNWSASMPNAIRFPARAASAAAGMISMSICLGATRPLLTAEAKARKDGGGFVQLERWLGKFDLLFFRPNNADPLVVLPWRIWERIIDRVRGGP